MACLVPQAGDDLDTTRVAGEQHGGCDVPFIELDVVLTGHAEVLPHPRVGAPDRWAAWVGARGPYGSPAPRPRPGPSRRQRIRASGRTPVREGSGRPPTAPPTPPVDDRLQQRPPSTRAVVGRIHIEHVQLPRPCRVGVQGRARHGDPDQLAIPLGDSRAVLAIALVGQRGSPEPLPSSQEAWVIEHRVRHESPIRLLPGPNIHARHLRDILDPSRANSQRGTHRRIVGRGTLYRSEQDDAGPFRNVDDPAARGEPSGRVLVRLERAALGPAEPLPRVAAEVRHVVATLLQHEGGTTSLSDAPTDRRGRPRS